LEVGRWKWGDGSREWEVWRWKFGVGSWKGVGRWKMEEREFNKFIMKFEIVFLQDYS
jgi:hypothetical protein